MGSSELENLLAFHMEAIGIPFTREIGFDSVAVGEIAAKRRWRWDFCQPESKLLIEVDGGTYSGGRHVQGAGYEADCEKQAFALVNGWRVLRVTGKQVRSGLALKWIELIWEGRED
jgi:very-short-patch-repair endonuclease